ncbi:MAG: hypothetical protein A3G93_13815 [Nitrospinae bacterium RIFCSPLOWO2_12_FULL_45_22]|nr:MAG: hypothetical protein A3G93_13815 [Nitrospinae bacterium RIFCSPLOWO2_12_FULL_45_22]
MRGSNSPQRGSKNEKGDDFFHPLFAFFYSPDSLRETKAVICLTHTADMITAPPGLFAARGQKGLAKGNLYTLIILSNMGFPFPYLLLYDFFLFLQTKIFDQRFCLSKT